MKKVLFLIISLFFMINIVNADGKVKVYVFEAGGCPYCEAEVEYLQGLSSYNKKFEIVRKELYVDHIDWKQGKDYEIGKKVAEEFQKAGFEDADYKATPFIVISDIYALAGYDTDLENIIDKAYEEGDKDAVKCLSSNKSNCIRNNVSSETTTGEISGTTTEENTNSSSGIIVAAVAFLAFIGAIIYVVKTKQND